jgi:glycosyltransferase involved in cell wall biosynthesis
MPDAVGSAGVSIVVPTVGRPSLAAVLEPLGPAIGRLRGGHGRGIDVEILVVDDRSTGRMEPLPVPPALADRVKVLSGSARGPAAARNTGWRAARHDWVAFLDDDVVPDPDWLDRLLTDLDLPEDVGGSQGRLWVPLPADRRPTDWERGTAALADGRWITADMAYRRGVLAAVGGFDERFPRAFREDAELAYRVRAAGWRLVRGRRRVTHPVRPEGPWVSLRTQRGNADDALLRRLYGPHWRRMVDVPPGRRRRHAAVAAAGFAALACAVAAGAARVRTRDGRGGAGRGWAGVAAVAGAGWLAGTGEFAAARIAPGPRDPKEIATMAVTSALIPPLAAVHWLRGWWRWRGAVPADRR